ncbi:VOC family protein [Mangrovivirga sp. M17]|uniref:VOC family protein n=1 Tax=Mangrovivirga halotolerans TaxID=2993936 RepID=A0ABT3RM18_9BACT|nr:ArsI/CadI family heavy metal resistance metalloenzyme [Mangrovivirga halotolerans]MCX2742759.1 VOC family protein [Mangrovivirga halotolerans]
MRRLHVHIRVKDLSESISFYEAVFNSKPDITKSDYAKWMLNDPLVNFAISTGKSNPGIEHLGIQVDSKNELEEVYSNLKKAKSIIKEEGKTTCCYSKSIKSWITDPQGVDWEVFYTHGSSTVYGEGIYARNDDQELTESIPDAPIKTCSSTCAND